MPRESVGVMKNSFIVSATFYIVGNDGFIFNQNYFALRLQFVIERRLHSLPEFLIVSDK